MARKPRQETDAVPDHPKATPDQLESEVKIPTVSVLERRLLDPFATSSTPIRLKDKSMTVRWVNSAIEGRYHRARHEQGWEPVRVEELEDKEDIADLAESPDGIVRRGERGKEVLMKMPAEVYERIQMRKAEVRQQRSRSSSRQKEELVNAAADRYGPEAGEYLDRHVKGEVIESTERVTS